ncbi:ABC transporter ATP-binding protein [Inquilinus sp. CAU 1745]|uniref:ABC transporter ATP-binding protein n=1 Tax=Inquilinus sp. CAU 1745 TaxID=3140369 RepID=UPI00325BD92D
MAASPAIGIVSVTKIYQSGQESGVTALDGVSLDIGDNEFFTLLGPSGCGKTTLLRLIAGFEETSGGHILLYGEEIEGLPPHKRPVNTVFQNYALFPHMTVEENIGFGLEMKRAGKEQARDRVARMLELVKLGGMEKRKPAQLSGGQQQRVALARALASEPRVLLLDEPLSALDLKLRKEMQIELKRLQTETGITFIFVTHDQEEALTMSDRIAVMSAGKILQVGAPREIYEHPTRRFVADFIGESNFLAASLDRVENGSARYHLSGGAALIGPPPANGEREVTLAVRPERVGFRTDGEGLEARVDNIVYFGTDTLYHVALKDSDVKLTVRVQNRDRAGSPAPGDAIRLTIAPDAIQVLED